MFCLLLLLAAIGCTTTYLILSCLARQGGTGPVAGLYSQRSRLAAAGLSLNTVNTANLARSAASAL